MSGRCYSCASGFGLFKKELGCKNCGYAFCKDCLKKKAAVPKRKNEVHKVCNNCYDILTGKVDPDAKKNNWSPPEAYKKRMAALNNPKPTSGPSTSGAKPKKHYPPNMRKEDIEIAERLEKLKEGGKTKTAVPSQHEIEARMKKLKEPIKPVPTEDEIRARMDKLHSKESQGDQAQGSTADTNSSQRSSIPPNTKGQQAVAPTTGKPMKPDEVHQLMGQYNELVGIDQKYGKDQREQDFSLPPTKAGAYDEEAEIRRLIEMSSKEANIESENAATNEKKVAEIRERLDRLKGSRKEGKKDEKEDGVKEELSEEAEAEQVLKQILGNRSVSQRGTADLSEKSAAEEVLEELEDAPESDPEDQLPWCCICNNDATLRCYGCDGDLYCNRCYKEGHDREDYADHKTKKFKPSTTSPYM